MVVISFSLKKAVTSTDLAYLIENVHIKREHVTKFLALFIDESLS